MKNLLVTAFAVCYVTVHAQDGDFFLTNYTPNLSNVEHLYFDMDFNSRGELIVANKSGVLKFDGEEWDFISTPSSVLSIGLGKNDRVYTGCAGDYGEIVHSQEGYKFKSLKKDTSSQIVYQVLATDPLVYFLEEHQLTIYNSITDRQISILPSDSAAFLDMMFEFEKKIYVQGSGKLYQIEKGQLVPTESILPVDDEILVCSKNENNGEYALATLSGKVYTYNGIFREKKIPQGLLINDIAWTSNERFGISTYSSGVILFDLVKNAVIGEVTGGKGLPDNEIYAITSDDRQGIWVANSFGFSRIAPEIPIRSFNYYPGIEGNLTSTIEEGDSRLVATSTGIYYFDIEEKYKNTVYYVPKSRVAKPTPKKEEPVEEKKKGGFRLKNLLPGNNDDSGEKKEKDGGGLFSGLFNNKDGDGVFSKIFKGDDKVEYERRVRKELISTRYFYKPVEGLHEKCTQLLRFGGRAYMASTPSGVIEIIDNEAHQIYTGPNRHIFHPENSESLLISTFDRGLVFLDSEEELWLEKYSLNIPGDVIIKMFQDSKDRIWGAGAHRLFQIAMTDSSARIQATYHIENQFFDDIEITELRGKLYLVNTLGYFYLDEQAGMVKRDEKLESELGIPRSHLSQSDHKVWVNNGDNWFRLDEEGQTRYTYLKLFPEMSFIDEVEGHLWIINEFKNLFRYVPGDSDSIPSSQMFYKSVESARGLESEDVSSINLTHNTNTIQIDMARPDYLGLLNVEYQYILEGRNESWSAWTTSSRLEFPFLPTGEYLLRVRSRDTFGRIQEGKPISITVSPPYWETGWFSACEVLFFAILVFGSARLNRTSTKHKYTLVTNILTVVTVVMIIEFLQNAAGSYVGNVGSPVLAFGIDVLVAVFVFPIEQFLRRIVEGKSPKKELVTGKA